MGKSCKVVVCGQASVGKTSILEQLLYGNHVVGESAGGTGREPAAACLCARVPDSPVLQAGRAWPPWARLCLETP